MTGAVASRPRGDGQSGVTLVEILVALVVIGLSLGLAATGLRLLGRSGERGTQLVARHDILSRGIDVLRRDIERIERVTRKRGERAELVFRGDAERLTFVAIEPPFPSETGPYVIGYAIQQRRDGVTLTRGRAPFQSSAPDLLRAPTEDSAAVIEGPYRLRFLYQERKAGRARWVPEWSDPYDPPELIGLEISGLDGVPLPLLVFRPRIDAEAGCIKDGGACGSAGQDSGN